MKNSKDFFYYESLHNNWKNKILNNRKIDGLSEANSDVLIQFILDMELGKNINSSTKKGSRGYHRLIVLRNKIFQFFRFLESRGIDNVEKINEDVLFEIAKDLEIGKIKNIKGEQYKSPSQFISTFKTFWNWYIKSEKKKGNKIEDICEDVMIKEKNENTFVYLSKEKLDELVSSSWIVNNENSTNRRIELYKNYKILTKFLFDSILRYPSEVVKLKVKNIYENDKEDVCVNVDSEVGTKTTNSVRSFNLLFSGDMILNYILLNKLKDEDYLFPFLHSPHFAKKYNKKLKEVCISLWGNVLSHQKAGKTFSEISGYDLRHSGAVYLRKIISETGTISIEKLMIRGGWSNLSMINYYTKFLDLDGIVDKDAMLKVEDRSKMQNELEKQRKEIDILKKMIMDSNEEQMDTYILKNSNSPIAEVDL